MDGATSVRRAAPRTTAAPAYNPDGRFDLVVSDVELRRNTAGRMLMARIYQPHGKGPFPAVLDLHGGAWTRKDRLAEEPMDRALRELGADVWISGVRRSHSSTRTERPFAEQQKRTLKVYPILDWPDAQISAYMHDHGLPPHPLAEQGYVTMGDWHSTRPAVDGLDPEATRFNGEKYECGLHIDSGNSDFQI